jgi:tetratricopeptide (TPR) repeat protein
VTDAVISQAGAAGRSSAPSLAELDRYGRAVVALDGGRLADAWHALGNKVTPASQALRTRLEAAGSSEKFPLSERARLAVARGDSERARLWLRSQMGANQDDALLALAAAEAAEELGDFERALSLFDRAIELDPDSRVARAGRRACSWRPGATTKASRRFPRSRSRCGAARDGRRVYVSRCEGPGQSALATRDPARSDVRERARDRTPRTRRSIGHESRRRDGARCRAAPHTAR